MNLNGSVRIDDRRRRFIGVSELLPSRITSLGNFEGSNLIDCFPQYFFIDSAIRGNAARGLVHGFLDDVAGMAFDPFPGDLVPTGRFVQALPPLQICFAAKAAHHGFDHITRVRVQMHTAGFAQRFKPDRGGGDLSLLVRGGTEIGPEGAPNAAITK